MTKYNLPFGSTVQGMELLHKGNHFKQKNAHPNHFYIMGMYRTPTAVSADINNWSKIATITGTNILHILAFSGVSQGSTTAGAYRLTIKVDPNNESYNVFNLENMATPKTVFKVVKNAAVSGGAITYDLYAQILNTSDLVYFSPLFIQNEQNVTFYSYQPYAVLPSTDSNYTRSQISFNTITSNYIGVNKTSRLATDSITTWTVSTIDYYDVGAGNSTGFPSNAPGTLKTYRASNDLYSYQEYQLRSDWGPSVYRRQWDTTNNVWKAWQKISAV